MKNKSVLKQISLIIMLLMILFFKTDACAEVIWNTTGEKSIHGSDWIYKYWNGTSWVYSNDRVGESVGIPKLVDITYEVTYCYEEAYKMNELVNEQRRLAGVPEVQMKDDLMDVAMKRAAETAIYWEHIRPDMTNIQSASMFIDGENLVANTLCAKVANDNLVGSPGHYAQMIDARYSYAGYGCVMVNGRGYWVQIFSFDFKYYEDGYDREWHYANDYYDNGVRVIVPSPYDKPVQWDKMPVGTRTDYTESFTIRIKPEYVTLKSSDFNNMLEGNSIPVIVGVSYTNVKKTWTTYVHLSEDQYTAKVLTPDVCSYADGNITALKEGTARIKFSLKSDTSKTTIMEVKIKSKPVKNGATYVVKDSTYKVTSASKKTVEFNHTNATKGSVSIPKSVNIKGKTYKVTSIGSDALRGNTNLRTVTVGSNITKISKNAFKECKNLKKIIVKSTKIKSVGKNAFKGINKNAVIKVPKSKLSRYKKLFRNKGQKKSVKIQK